jgi:hypothetical protein
MCQQQASPDITSAHDEKPRPNLKQNIAAALKNPNIGTALNIFAAVLRLITVVADDAWHTWFWH